MGKAFLHGTGGNGAGLNFKLVGGLAQPSGHAENTIWVYTADKITGYAFSPTAPAEPVEGLVWILTGTSSNVAFNALKKNGIQVYPTSVKQYVGGAWVDKEAKSYQNGEWVEWFDFATWIYNEGTINTSLTGGFTAYAYGPSTSSGGTQVAPTVTIGDNSISLYLKDGYKGAYFSNNLVDLTNYSVLKIEVTELTVGSSGSYVRIATSQERKSGYAISAGQSITELGVTSLDISALTGAHYILINLYTNYVKSVTFTRWWLE